jgi:mRNA-degrading endonuclease RelE of RelBE toxin-antitoxin system
MKIEMVPVGVQFLFRLPPKNKSKILRQFYGYKDSSKFGQYQYQHKGILSSIPSLKIARSVLIVRHQDRKKIIKFFNASKITYQEQHIILNIEQAKLLGISYPSKWKKYIDDLRGSKDLLVTADF